MHKRRLYIDSVCCKFDYESYDISHAMIFDIFNDIALINIYNSESYCSAMSIILYLPHFGWGMVEFARLGIREY